MAAVREYFMVFFRYYFGRFWVSRRGRSLFRRQPILESVARGKRTAPPEGQLNRRLVEQARTDLNEILTQLETSAQGLDELQAKTKLQIHGPNKVEHDRPLPWWRHLWLSYNNPFNLLLTVLAAVSFFTGDMQGTVVIGIMVVLATLIRFFQERRSNLAGLTVLCWK